MPKIANINLENNLILAPMLGVNCNAFRLLCKNHGASLVSTPMIHPDSIFNQKDKDDIIKQEKPISAQIVGKDPEKMSRAAIILEEKADIIDINLGCPDKDVLA
ncbi:MAG: tRNA-dihydrouridine synthase, partial [Candidatus Aminicenantes bacterium]|nr:tRNA-dihydrouridine synthase [Candidatus Aminicenantes bacterium]